MSGEYLVPILAFTTLGLAVAFAVFSKRRTEQKLEGDKVEKSSLAKDGPGPQPFR